MSLGWLTSWGRGVDAIIDELFAGKYLASGYVIGERLSSRYVAGSWKMDALISHLDEIGNPAYAWADDDAVDLALLDRQFLNGHLAGEPRLLLSPRPDVGLTLEHLAQIETFIDGQTGRGRA